MSKRYGECWVFPRDVVYEIVAINSKKYGSRADNMNGPQAEMDLDIKHEGLPLTERYSEYRNDFQIMASRFTRTRD